MAAMLSSLGGRGYGVKEEPAVYGSEGIDFDPDFDFDLDDNESQQKSDFGRYILEVIVCVIRTSLCIPRALLPPDLRLV